MTIFLLLVFAIIIAGIWQGAINNKRHKLLKEQLLTVPTIVPGFKVDKSYVHHAGLSYIALDNTNKQILLATPKSKVDIAKALAKDKSSFIVDHKLISYNDIIKSELIVDGQTVSSKSYSGALAGGLLLGTTGAVIGSNTGKTKYSKDIKTIKLKLLLNDVANPSYELLFYNKTTDIKATLNKAQESCQNWQDTLSVVINQRLAN